MTPNPNDMSAAAEDAAIMYRGDCYKGNHTNPHVRESYADQGYEGFLAGVAWAKSQAASEVTEAVRVAIEKERDRIWSLLDCHCNTLTRNGYGDHDDFYALFFTPPAPEGEGR
jgi:hypothetical protein